MQIDFSQDFTMPQFSVKKDIFLLVFLMISVSHVFFQLYGEFFIVPVFFMLLTRPLSKQCKRVSLWLLLFSVLYLIGCHFHGGVGLRSQYVTYLFPPIFYMSGCYLGMKYKWTENILVVILFSILFMFAVFDLVQIYLFLFASGEAVIISRAILNENDSITRGATGYAMILSVLIAGLALIFAPAQKGSLKWVRILGIIFGVLSIYGMSAIVTRTSIVEAAVVLLFSILMMLKEQKKQRYNAGFLIGTIVLVISVYFFVKSSSFSQLVDAYKMRADSNDTAGGRTIRWLAAMKNLLTNPIGTPTGRIIGLKLNNSYAHNMWLDVGLRSGWFPFIIFLAFSIRNFRQSIGLLKDKSYQYFTRLYFFSVFIVFIIGCSIEPVLDGVYDLFLVYLVFCGMVSEMKPKRALKN